MPEISFKRAVSILDQLLEGKSPKEIAYNLRVTQADVTAAKKKFPLFVGLTNKYTYKDE